MTVFVNYSIIKLSIANSQVDSFARMLPDGNRLWALEDVKAIVEEYGIVVITRYQGLTLL